MIAFAFIPVGAIYNIIMDRSKLTKHQQLVSGISFISYWVGNFVADFIASIPAMLIVYILNHAFDVDVYLGDAQGPFLLILVVFTVAILPFTYILSYFFTAPDKGYVMRQYLCFSFLNEFEYKTESWHVSSLLSWSLWTNIFLKYFKL